MKPENLSIQQGKTWSVLARWEGPPIIYKPITGVTQAAPVVITATGHGIPDGWRAAIVSVRGMTELNAEDDPPTDDDLHSVTVIDTDHVSINDINAADYTAYTSGGYLRFNTPIDMNGYTCRMKIKDKIGGTVLASTEIDDAPLDTITATIDNTAKTITIEIAAADTEAFAWRRGVFDIEMVSATGVVTLLAYGTITVSAEVTN